MKNTDPENISVSGIESSTKSPKPPVRVVSCLESQLRIEMKSRIKACLGLKIGLYVLGRNLSTVQKIPMGIYSELPRNPVLVTSL